MEEVVKDGNGAAAAIRAGYAAKYARQTAYDLRQKPEINDAIRERYKLLAMSAEEATKRISDNAATRLNDYIRVDEVWETPMVKKTLLQLIGEIQFEVDLENEVFDRISGEMNEKEQNIHHAEQSARKRKILRYEIELELNPNAYRVMKGEPILVRTPSVDLIKLAQADEKGSIKKLSFNERGLPSVECYSAEKALETVLKLNGKLIDRHDVNNGDKTFEEFLMDT